MFWDIDVAMDEDIRQAKDFLREDIFDEYERMRDDIWNEFVTINIRLFTLQRIESFPFDVFIPDNGDRVFWQTVRNALFESIIVALWRITFDRGSGVFTIFAFRDVVVEASKD